VPSTASNGRALRLFQFCLRVAIPRLARTPRPFEKLDMKIQGTTAFVTGAAGGIGQHFVEALLQRGARLVYASDLAGKTLTLADERVVPIALDITDESAVAKAASAASDVQLLINNAGINLRAPFIKAPSLASARREIETNYLGTLAMCRAFAPVLAAFFNLGGSAIVNVASILGKVTLPNLGSYCASKAALLRLSEGVRAELARQRTGVVLVLPWAVDTPMSGPFPGDKTSPGEVAMRALDAVENNDDEVLLHNYSLEIERRLREDAKALELELGATFRIAP
jgi:NAD(P)-dependent dehydrogenase (short-subunit alcohol dehydrogenase family)